MGMNIKQGRLPHSLTGQRRRETEKVSRAGSQVGSGKNLIFVKDLQHIVQNGENDLGLQSGVGHVVALVRTHDRRSTHQSQLPFPSHDERPSRPLQPRMQEGMKKER